MKRARWPSLRLSRWLAIPVCLGWFCGCATLPPHQIPATAISEEFGSTLLHEWLTASGRHEALQGVAKLRVQTPQRTLSGTQVLLVEKPDRLRAETLSPFGTPVLVLAADGSELAVLLPGDNLFYRGRATAENLGRFTRLPLHPADLVNILLAQPPVLAHRRLTIYQLPEGGWQVELDAGARRQQLVFDSARRLREVRYLQDDILQLQVSYGAAGADPQALPLQIELDLPQQQTRASLAFAELVADHPFPPGSFTLTAPAGTAVVTLDEAPAAGAPSIGQEAADPPPALSEGGR